MHRCDALGAGFAMTPEEEKTLKAENEQLRQQLVAVDRILEGRRIAHSAMAAEGSFFMAPYLEVFGLFDRGVPSHQITAVQAHVELQFGGPDGHYSRFQFNRTGYDRPVPVGRLTAESRLVIAILGGPR